MTLCKIIRMHATGINILLLTIQYLLFYISCVVHFLNCLNSKRTTGLCYCYKLIQHHPQVVIFKISEFLLKDTHDRRTKRRSKPFFTKNLLSNFKNSNFFTLISKIHHIDTTISYDPRI